MALRAASLLPATISIHKEVSCCLLQNYDTWQAQLVFGCHLILIHPDMLYCQAKFNASLKETSFFGVPFSIHFKTELSSPLALSQVTGKYLFQNLWFSCWQWEIKLLPTYMKHPSKLLKDKFLSLIQTIPKGWVSARISKLNHCELKAWIFDNLYQDINRGFFIFQLLRIADKIMLSQLQYKLVNEFSYIILE